METILQLSYLEQYQNPPVDIGGVVRRTWPNWLSPILRKSTARVGIIDPMAAMAWVTVRLR